MKIVKKPWGGEHWFAQVPGKYMGKVLIIFPGQQVSFHKHIHKEEHFFIQQGTMQLWTSTNNVEYDEDNIIKEKKIIGETIHIRPNQPHSMKNIGSDDVILFEVSTYFPDDSVRIKDFYGRGENNEKKNN